MPHTPPAMYPVYAWGCIDCDKVIKKLKYVYLDVFKTNTPCCPYCKSPQVVELDILVSDVNDDTSVNII